VVMGLAAGTGCASSDGSSQLTVFAAASLVEPFSVIEESFEAAHPGVDVVMVHAGSADLAAQIIEGAPADVFAAADEAQMAVIGEHAAAPPAVFATNTLTIVVPRGNPAAVGSIESLGDPSVVSVVCAPQVPCGASSARLAALAGVALVPSSEETSVTGVLSKVAEGHADAGLVYVTDVARRTGVEAVATEHADEVVNAYPIAALTGSDQPDLSAGFVDYVLTTGQEALDAYGFGTVQR